MHPHTALCLHRPWLAAMLLALVSVAPPAAVGDGDDLLVVPNLYGRTFEEAHRMLRPPLLFGPVGWDGATLSDAPGQVVDRQDPRAGTYVAMGTQVRTQWRAQPDGPRLTTVVPALEGLTREGAQTAAIASGFYVRLAYTTNAEGAAFHRVYRQTPVPGARALPGSVIFATIRLPSGVAAPGLALVTVPDLLGRRRGEVGPLLAERGLIGPISLNEAGGHPEMHVVSRQVPAPRDRVERGTQVRVGWIAPSGAFSTVPYVVGMSLADARAAIAAVELAAEVVFEPRPGMTGGGVYRQSPDAGTRAPHTSSVRITLNSVGMATTARRVAVPNLFRMTAEEAWAALSAVGLRVRRDPATYTRIDVARYMFPRPALPGRVWGWAPAGEALTGTEVLVRFLSEDAPASPGATMVLVPELRWRTQADAEAALATLGLGAVARSTDRTRPPGESDPVHAPPATPLGAVWWQHPSPGHRVARGSMVTFAYRGAAPRASDPDRRLADDILVPDVQRRNAAAAIAILRGQRLDGAIDPATRPAGVRDTRLEVVTQTPAPGARRPAGTVVRLHVRRMRATMPSVIGLSVESATARVRDAFLSVELLGPPSRGLRTRVTQQQPEAGRILDDFSMVQLTYVAERPVRVR